MDKTDPAPDGARRVARAVGIPESRATKSRTLRVKVPAKAMLFGEYGVLEGGPAFAVVLPYPFFELELRLVHGACAAPRVTMHSAFFSQGRTAVSLGALTRLRDAVLPTPPRAFPDLDTVSALPMELSPDALDPWMPRDAFARALAAWVLPFVDELADALGQGTHDSCDSHGSLEMSVLTSFSPAWGMGSSSALIAGIHAGLEFLLGAGRPAGVKSGDVISVLDTGAPLLRALTSLRLGQGRGSGYDVAVQKQSARILELSPRAETDTPEFSDLLDSPEWKRALGGTPGLWRFQWCDGSPRAQCIGLPVPLSCMGVLIETGVYSHTAAALSSVDAPVAAGRAARHLSRSEAARRHEACARAFETVRDTTALAGLVDQARDVAIAHGILPIEGPSPLARLARLLLETGLPFKSMGAGGGDCLWVLATRAQIEELSLVHPVTGKGLADSIVFSFADTCSAHSE